MSEGEPGSDPRGRVAPVPDVGPLPVLRLPRQAGKAGIGRQVARGDQEAIRRLVASGTSVELESSIGFTPLTIAARFGYGSVVDLLLKFGARVDGPGDPASTPIIHAAEGGHAAVAEQLWRAGANIAP